MKIGRNQQAFVLAYALLFSFLVISSLTVYIASAINSYTNTNRMADMKKAYYIADAGLSEAYLSLKNNLTPPLVFVVNEPNFTIGNGKTGSYSVTVSGSGTTWKTYTLTSTGTYNGLTKRLVLTVQESAISSMAYMSNGEIHPVWGPLWWITGMTTVGPVRTNGSLNIWGNPIFDGTTTQSGAGINYWNGGPPNDNPAFVSGLNVSAPSLPVTAASMLNNILISAGGGLILTGDSTIYFNVDGSLNVTNAGKSWNNTNIPAPANGVLYVQHGSATVEGTINGQLTVAADTEVFISGNLVYKKDPRVDPTSTDLLGLVSKNSITVLANSAPPNIELDAALVALNGSFQVDQWWIGGKGNMIQYGSLVNNFCGPTGVFDPRTGHLFGGYNQLQYYDTRLQTSVPPGFPPALDVGGRIMYNKLGFAES